jgi:type VI secretion system protein ImpL
MSDSGKQLRASLIVSGLILLSGVFVLLVWFFGDPLGFIVQVALTALVLFAWVFGLIIFLVVRRRRARRALAPAADAGAAQVATPPQQQKNALAAPTGNYPELSRGAEEATQWLLGTKLGGNRKAGEPVYALPWFLVAGSHGAGKSSLALSSGFDFHALPSQRSSEQNLIRPTANCEFRVTDNAVLIDTSGRYQTEGPDRDEWAALLETLKTRRKARPVDGFILAVNAAAILRSGEQEIEQQSKVLRARLDEALLRTRTRFPVYLVFTHMDEIEGFGEFFSTFAPEERAQVWGTTIPLAQSQSAHTLFDPEFDQLYARLVRRRMFQLGGATSPAAQLQLFKFPGRFRRARARLGLFTSVLFRPNPFSESPLLRGFYFTSSGAVGAVGARRLTGAEFFARGFFHNVVLPDKDIVAAEQAGKRRPHLWRNVLFALAGLAIIALMAGMVVSYFNNSELMVRAQAAHTRLEGARSVASREPDNVNAFSDELDATEEMRQLLAELDANEKNSPPISERFGLYTGGWLNASSSDPQKESILRHAYFEAVAERFLRPTVAKMETELRSFVANPQGASSITTNSSNATISSNPSTTTGATGPQSAATTGEDYLGAHYDLLKAYMMLSKPDKVEPAFLVNELSDYWKLAAPPGREADALRQLEYFASQSDHVDAPHPEPDDALVAEAQQRLTAYPQLSRVYKRITAEVNKEVKYPVNLSTIQGAREGNVLTGSYNVPPAFTLEGYRAMKDKLDNSATDEFRKDDWVMKGAESAEREIGIKKDELENVYYGDYVRHWQNFLQDIKVREPQRKDDAVRILRALSDENSPLDKVLREVARQTKLSAAPGGGVTGWVKKLFARQTGISTASAQVENRFAPLIKLMSGDATATAEYRSRLKKVSDKLNSNPKSLEEISKGIQAGSDPIELNASRQFVNDMLDSKGFGSSTASDAAAQLLKRPLDNLNSTLVGADFELMERAWQQLAAKSQSLEAGFPFADAGSDSSVAALAQFLNPQDGELTKFFNERLATFFDETWTPKRDAADKFAPDFIAYLANAKKLSDALFPDKGKQPKIEYQISVAPIKGAIIRVVIDGNTITAPDKPSASFQWPGDKSGATITTTPSTGEDVSVPFPGEWGLLHLFRQSGGGEGKGAQFTLQVKPAGAAITVPPVAITVQPKSGTIFQRDLFAALKAPKRLQRQ